MSGTCSFGSLLGPRCEERAEWVTDTAGIKSGWCKKHKWPWAIYTGPDKDDFETDEGGRPRTTFTPRMDLPPIAAAPDQPELQNENPHE
jgi:hypothetical protein